MPENKPAATLDTPMLMRPKTPPRWATIPVPAPVLPAVAVAGIAAAVLLPLDRPGVGWVLTGLAVVGAVVFADRRTRNADTTTHYTRMSPVWAGAAILLLAAGFVRASEWLFVLCVLAAGVTGSIAAVGRRSAGSVLYEVIAVPVEALRAVPWLGRALKQHAGGGDNDRRRRIAVSLLASAVLLAVFIPLLSGADAAFAHVMSSLLPDLDEESLAGWIFAFCLAGGSVAGACYLLVSPLPAAAEEDTRRRLAHRMEWALPLGVLVALFVVFVGVQLVVLFGGTDYMLRTAGLTAADYARGGFWQLCAATVLTLALVGAALRWAPNSTRADRTWQRGLLGALSALSLVLVASALSRMWTYQQAYGFTVLRLLVEACELWLGAVFVLVIVSLVRLRPAWLPRAAVGAAAVALLALVALDPERFIADRNIDRAEHGKPVDVWYLGGFSADVVPAAERLPEPARSCVLRAVLDGLDDDGWNAWNLSRSAARNVTDLRDTYSC
jgi:ABC-type amino acid transport system permease subunit